MPVSHYQGNMVSNSPLISKIGNLLLERVSSVCVFYKDRERGRVESIGLVIYSVHVCGLIEC